MQLLFYLGVKLTIRIPLHFSSFRVQIINDKRKVYCPFFNNTNTGQKKEGGDNVKRLHL